LYHLQLPHICVETGVHQVWSTEAREETHGLALHQLQFFDILDEA
jgi:hypothetical protein